MYVIYCIEHVKSGKKYIGKSSNVKQRFSIHRWSLTRPVRHKDCNRYLYNAVQKYGIRNFKFYIIEEFEKISEGKLKNRELYWMDFYKSCERQFGYNLRRDSSTKMFTSKETLELQSKIHKGKNNANYGNRWNERQKGKMSAIAKRRHKLGIYYTEKTKDLHRKNAKIIWKSKKLRKQISLAVSKAKQKYNFYQYNLDGKLLKIWESVKEIIKENPDFSWANIYAACGNKPTYKGYKWKKKLKKK